MERVRERVRVGVCARECDDAFPSERAAQRRPSSDWLQRRRRLGRDWSPRQTRFYRQHHN